MYLYGSGFFFAGIACSTMSKHPALCPRVAHFLQRIWCLDRVDTQQLDGQPDALEEDASAVDSLAKVTSRSYKEG